MRYKLRTLLLLLAILPPLLWLGWTRYEAWKAERDRRAELERVMDGLVNMPIIDELGEPVPRPGLVLDEPRSK